ncbi:MAG TPA: hypothetical protein VMG30_01130 [Acidobacteriota bacterium]|nr:hypothetical protein [Acidobacteriota bacterium]
MANIHWTRKRLLLVAVAIILGINAARISSQGAAIEMLDEMVSRKSRLGSANWGPQYLEDASNHYTWQPETLCYTDQSTGREVWILVKAPDNSDYYSKEHGSNIWSYDGSRIGFFDIARTTRNPAIVSDYRYRWVTNTDGSGLRVCEGYGRRTIPLDGFGWAHTENAYYSFGSGTGDVSESKCYILYKNTLDALNRVSGIQVLDTASTNMECKEPVKEGVSGDDGWIVARDFSPHDAKTPNPILTTEMYFIRLGLKPSLKYHWGIARGIGPAKDPYADHIPLAEEHWHDVWAPGPDPKWIMGDYAGQSSLFVTMDRTGHAADGGPIWSDWDGKSFGEIRVESSGSDEGPPNPYGMPYFGHPAFDRWGRYAVIGTYTDPQSAAGTRLWDSRTHTLLPNYMMKGIYDGQHHSWNGWTDHVVMVNPLVDYIYGNLYTSDETSRYPIVSLHYPGYSGNYNGYPRPSQSPDGTKVAFQALWLNNHGDNHPYICWAVAYYPYPPKNLSAEKAGAAIKLVWKFPSYTSRGWPTENDPVPAAREIKGYHVWRSDTGDSDWSEITPTVSLAAFFKDATVKNGQTYYYAVTSEEHSRLESRELSEILKCSLDPTGLLTSVIVQPRGFKNFWKTPPPSPLNLTIESSRVAGHYKLTWREPPNAGKIRYYNIYYSTAGAPATNQRFRIASLPVGTTKYLDWLADPWKTPYYRVTSVDRQGNESQGVDVNSVKRKPN